MVRKMHKFRKMLINAGLVLIVILLFFSFFEIFLRIIGMNCLITDKTGAGIYNLTGDEYSMKPNYNGRFKCLEFDTSIKTNSDGYRDNEFNISGKKILLFGDSIVFGQGIEQGKTFADILENETSKYGFSVYNLGVPGYSPKDYIAQYDQYSKKFNPEFVIVALYEGNDAQENCEIINRTAFFLGERKGFGGFKDSIKRFYFVGVMEPLLRNLVDWSEATVTSKQFYLVDEPESVTKCNKLLKENMKILMEKTKKDNKKIIFLILPSKINFASSKNPKVDYNKKLDTIMAFCDESNLTCFNLKDASDNPEKIYLKEGHFNEKGHQEIAVLLAKFLEQNKFLSSALS